MCVGIHTAEELEHFEGKRAGIEREKSAACAYCVAGCCKWEKRGGCWRGLGDSDYSSSDGEGGIEVVRSVKGGGRGGRGQEGRKKMSGLGEGRMVAGRVKRRVGMKYVKVKDEEVWSDDGVSDDNLYMVLEGDVAGVQVGAGNEHEWEGGEDGEDGAEDVVERATSIEVLEGIEDAKGGWLENARKLAQAGVRKVWGGVKFGSRRAEQVAVRQVLQVVEVGVMDARRKGAVGGCQAQKRSFQRGKMTDRCRRRNSARSFFARMVVGFCRQIMQ